MSLAVWLQDAGHVVTGAGLALWVAHALVRRFRRNHPAMASTGLALAAFGEALYGTGALTLSQGLGATLALVLAALFAFLSWHGFRHPEVFR